jgi:hypothetical protein
MFQENLIKLDVVAYDFYIWIGPEMTYYWKVLGYLVTILLLLAVKTR